MPTIAAAATYEQPLTGFRGDDASMFDPTALHASQVTVAARDTLAKTYDVTVPWGR